MATKIQFRRDTYANWDKANPILMEGEIGYVIDDPNRRYKIGDGVHKWKELSLCGFDGNLEQTTGNSPSSVMSQKAVTSELEETKNRITGVSDSSSSYTDPFISLGELANWQELSNTLNTLYEKKYMGRCRATVAGMNVEIYQFVQNFANKTFSQVVLGNVAPSEDGTQVVIKTVEHFDILARYCVNEVWSVWKSVSKQNIPVATPTADGLMSSVDKSKLDGYPDAGDFTFLSNDEPLVEDDSVTIFAQTASGESEQGIRIEAATTEAAGLMSALDKQKVNTLGTGVRIDNMVQIKNIIDGNNKRMLVLGTDKDASGVSIEKIGNFGVKIGSATLGGNSGGECYVGNSASIGDNAFIDDNTSLSNQGWCYKLGTMGTFCAGAEIGTDAVIGRQAKIYREAQIGTGTVIDEYVSIGTDYGVTVYSSDLHIGTGVKIGRKASLGTDTTIGTEVGIGNGVKIDEDIMITKDGSSGFYIGTENHKVYLDKRDNSAVQIGSAYFGREVNILDDVRIGTGVEINITEHGYEFGTICALGRYSYIGDNVGIKIYTSSGMVPTDFIFGNSQSNDYNVVISNENDVNAQRYRLGTGDTASYIGNNVYLGENACLGDYSGMDTGIYIDKLDGKLHIGGDAGQDVYIGRPSYLGVGARVEDGVRVGTNVTVDNTNNMNEVVLGEAFAYRIGTSIVQQASGIKIGEDIKIGRGVTIGDPSTLLGWSGVTIEDGAYLGNSAKMWGSAEIGTAVNIVDVNITGYSDRVVISNGEGKTITLNWDN